MKKKKSTKPEAWRKWLRSYVSDKYTEKALALRGGRSSTIRMIVSRYVEMCRHDIPSMNRQEWVVVRAALKEVPQGIGEYEYISGLPEWIASRMRHEKLLIRHKVNGPALMKKLDGMTFGELVAVEDKANLYWQDRKERI